MSFDLPTVFIMLSFLLIPTVSFLLPSTGVALLQAGVLFLTQAAFLFLFVNELFGAVVWMIYVGAVSVLFLVTITALTPNQWHSKNERRIRLDKIIIGGVIAAFLLKVFTELQWFINSLRSFPNYETALASYRLSPNSYLVEMNNLIWQNIVFAEHAKIYIISGLLLLVGMYVVIQTTTAPKTIITYLKNKIVKFK